VIGVETSVEYFLDTQLKGHCFFFCSNNQDGNLRNNYRDSDADAAINQPLFGRADTAALGLQVLRPALAARVKSLAGATYFMTIVINDCSHTKKPNHCGPA
jgi:hypothetical protein